MLLSLNQPDVDRISSLSSLVRVYCIIHPCSDTSTRLIRTSTVGELNTIFCRFAKSTIASVHTSGIIYYTFKRHSGCLTPDIKCNRTIITQISSPLVYVLSRMPFLQYSWYPFLHFLTIRQGTCCLTSLLLCRQT